MKAISHADSDVQARQCYQSASAGDVCGFALVKRARVSEGGPRNATGSPPAPRPAAPAPARGKPHDIRLFLNTHKESGIKIVQA